VKSLRCILGHHDDGTDAFGGYSPTCLRCGRPLQSGATPTARGVAISVIGVVMIFFGMVTSVGISDMITAVALGGLLFVLGLFVVWTRKP
jgi:hypothetical protein